MTIKMSLCKKAGRKLSGLARILSFSNFEQCRILMELFIETQFNHNPITWMFHRGKTEQRLNHL